MSPRCAALSERLSPEGRRALAAFLAGRLPAGQLHAELLRTSAAGGSSAMPGESAGAGPGLRAA